jgi:uncharacterized protein YciI
MKRYLLIFAVILAAGCTEQTVPENVVETTQAAPSYNAALAEELGADEYGMRSYVMVILKTGPNDKTLTDETKRADIFKGHFSNMRILAEDKKLILAGPFGDPEGIKRGLYIFNVKTIEEAQELVMTDPAVKAGIFTPEFTPYYGSAALIQVNSVHKQIAKSNPG